MEGFGPRSSPGSRHLQSARDRPILAVRSASPSVIAISSCLARTITSRQDIRRTADSSSDIIGRRPINCPPQQTRHVSSLPAVRTLAVSCSPATLMPSLLRRTEANLKAALRAMTGLFKLLMSGQMASLFVSFTPLMFQPSDTASRRSMHWQCCGPLSVLAASVRSRIPRSGRQRPGGHSQRDADTDHREGSSRSIEVEEGRSGHGTPLATAPLLPTVCRSAQYTRVASDEVSNAAPCPLIDRQPKPFDLSDIMSTDLDRDDATPEVRAAGDHSQPAEQALGSDPHPWGTVFVAPTDTIRVGSRVC